MFEGTVCGDDNPHTYMPRPLVPAAPVESRGTRGPAGPHHFQSGVCLLPAASSAADSDLTRVAAL